MLSRSRRGLLVLLMCGSALLLSACGTSFDAQTNQVYTAGIGHNHRTGDIEILNALFVDNGDGTATFSAALLAKTPGGDRVESVAATDTGGNDIKVEMRTPVDLPEEQVVNVGEKPRIVLPDGGFQNGYLVRLTLTFANAEPISIQAPVVERTSMYDSVATPSPAKSE